MTPVIAELAEAGYEIDAVVSDNGSHEILKLRSDVRKQYLWSESQSAFSNLLRLGSELRKKRYDAAYALYPNGKRENALLCLARAAEKSRYSDSRSRYRLLDFLPATQKVPLKKAHDVNSNLRLIQTNGAVSEKVFPALDISAANQDFANDFSTTHDLANKFVIAIHPGGGGLAKRWSADKYRDLCVHLLQDESVALLVFGSSSEERLVMSITDGLGKRAVPVCGLGIDKVAALIARSQLLVANDSALAHIASALDVAAIVIWGYTDFRRVAPLGHKGLLIRIDYPCSPCYEFTRGYIDDCRYHLKCIKDISVGQVHRIVSRYISSIRKHESLEPEIFAGEPDVSSLQRVQGGCLQIDLKAA
jgi:ADP-heptose:LPS heptosyltransferase